MAATEFVTENEVKNAYLKLFPDSDCSVLPVFDTTSFIIHKVD